MLDGTKVSELAALILAETKDLMHKQGLDFVLQSETVKVHPKKKYTLIDIGPEYNMSGRYMIENETGDIYGIKAYGVIHRGHYYGTLETIHEYYWGGYRAIKK
jgi:hypothetical protein